MTLRMRKDVTRKFNAVVDSICSLLSIGKSTATEQQAYALDAAHGSTENIPIVAHQHLPSLVFGNTHDSIVITNIHGQIIDVNPAFERLTGYLREDVVGLTLSILHSGRHDHAFYEEMWRELISNKTWEGEVWDKRKNGEIYAAKLRLVAATDAGGRVTHYVGIKSDITASKNQQLHLIRASTQDALTLLPNRAQVTEYLRRSLLAADQTGRMVAICSIDLDGFQAINENSGREIGDSLLIAVGQRIKSYTCVTDTVARVGGDEFLVVLSSIKSIRECKKTISRIIEAIAAPYSTQGKETSSVTASIGVVLYPRDDGDADTLLRHADQAMYQAKQEGGNRYHFSNSSRKRENLERSRLLSRFAIALGLDELLLFYQPKVDMTTGAILGVEALLRWQHPERGVLLPGNFLPQIESTPTAIRLGYWVIERVLRQIATWQVQGLSMRTSINIPGQLLLHKGFPQRVSALLAHYPNLDGSMIEMEILENAPLENLEIASTAIRACKELGISFSLDDFGTGYSSLNYLKYLDVDLLKIDQTFVRDLISNPEDLAIIEGTLSLSETFCCHTIAEGVETIEAGVMLLQLGCRYAQGNAIALPMSPEMLVDWIEQWRLPEEWRTATATTWLKKDIPLLEAGIRHRQWVARATSRAQGATAATPVLSKYPRRSTPLRARSSD